MIEAAIFTQEYVINNMFLPGQIENWVVIMDMHGLGAKQLPREVIGIHFNHS